MGAVGRVSLRPVLETLLGCWGLVETGAAGGGTRGLAAWLPLVFLSLLWQTWPWSALASSLGSAWMPLS